MYKQDFYPQVLSGKAGMGVFCHPRRPDNYFMMLKLSFVVNAGSNSAVLNVSPCHLTLPEPTHQQIGANKFRFFLTEFLALSSSS